MKDSPAPPQFPPADSRHLRIAMAKAMERAAVSGLCREGQLELAVQEARLLRPELDQAKLQALAEAVYRALRFRGSGTAVDE